MKHTHLSKAILGLLLIATILSSVSCAAKPKSAVSPDKNVVGTLTMGSPDLGFDINSLSGAVEMADLIAIGTITDTVKVVTEEDMADLPLFSYELRIDEILYDRHGTESVGSVIPMNSRSGYLPAKEYAEMLGETARGQKLGYDKKEFGENDYYCFPIMDLVPYEENRQYLVFLNDEFMEQEGAWYDASYAQGYLIEDQTLYAGASLTSISESTDAFLAKLDKAIASRKGILDDGYGAYLAGTNK